MDSGFDPVSERTAVVSDQNKNAKFGEARCRRLPIHGFGHGSASHRYANRLTVICAPHNVGKVVLDVSEFIWITGSKAEVGNIYLGGIEFLPIVHNDMSAVVVVLIGSNENCI